jgi:hypothetical protein
MERLVQMRPIGMISDVLDGLDYVIYIRLSNEPIAVALRMIKRVGNQFAV